MKPTAQANIDLIKAWLDAHNAQDMRALDYMADDIEIVETPTGVVWRGRKDMENLARLAYSRKSFKKLTHIFATDIEACVEYLTIINTADAVSDFEREQGLHGIDVSKAKPTVQIFELPVCFVCEIEAGKIIRAREYWDAASLEQQLGTNGGEEESTASSTAEGLTPKVILEEEVAKNLKAHPEITQELHGICQFDISGPSGGQWYVDLDQDCTVAGGSNSNAACTITMKDDNFVALFSGRLSSQRAFLTGKLKVNGDLAMASALRDVLRQS